MKLWGMLDLEMELPDTWIHEKLGWNFANVESPQFEYLSCNW